MALLMACCDFLAGPIIFFPVLFVIPVALMAWNCGLRTALRLAVVLCIIRFSFQYAWGIPYPLPVAIINGVLRVAILLFITFLCGKLSALTQALRARVRTLEGLLPTCSYCKDIRDENGEWQQMEEYVASRSGALFTHGICPKCVTTHFGDVMNQAEERKGAGDGH
ncbi:MAG: hypothetical protein K9N47_25805 [Prosthecobacter sp.]|uniref:hypothetical protein n=1 Tax=Prosthecobacter sp. TaxID=1965333 RepID=UPI002633A5DC|nr:hypothetical protein [Prosthecobacter sp.]MCF7789565.1 hypothetical protein [Prosthecobacter sp.]